MSPTLGRRASAALLIIGLSALAGACTGQGTAPPAATSAAPSQAPPPDTGGAATTPVSSSPARTTAAAPDDAARTSTPPGPCEGEPLIEGAHWIELAGRPSLEVSPTKVLRQCGPYGGTDRAWAELLETVPDADTDGMQEQFACHVLFASTKDVWHLEPWRPAVDGAELLAARCNPGGADPDLG